MDASVIAAFLLKFFQIMKPAFLSFIFRVGVGQEGSQKENFFFCFFLKSEGFKWVRFHGLICFQLPDRPCRVENAEQLKCVEAAGTERH